MKIIVAVCVYDRFENVKEWLRCWKLCEQKNAELVIIHNYYGNEEELLKFKTICDADKIKYIPRNDKGYDVGSFKNACQENLKGFPNDWDYLLWCCDDTIPMSKDFIQPYLNKFKENIGVVCMEISSEVKLHFRTTGFMLKKATANKLKFPIDIITKDDCYAMEHNSTYSFYCQIIKMGMRVLMVALPKESPLWDMGYLNRGRSKEHYSVFTNKNKVTFICPMFDAFPEIISSLMCQTYKNWELILIDDNPEKTIAKDIVDVLKDKRITYIKRERMAKWGHPHRQWALNEIKDGRLGKETDYIVITNADNFYVPVFIEYMLNGFIDNPHALATYCNLTVHSYIAWGVMECRFERGFLDCGQVMVKKETACEIGWNSYDHSSDWTYFNEIASKYGIPCFIPVKGALFVHN